MALVLRLRKIPIAVLNLELKMHISANMLNCCLHILLFNSISMRLTNFRIPKPKPSTLSSFRIFHGFFSTHYTFAVSTFLSLIKRSALFSPPCQRGDEPQTFTKPDYQPHPHVIFFCSGTVLFSLSVSIEHQNAVAAHRRYSVFRLRIYSFSDTRTSRISQ